MVVFKPDPEVPKCLYWGLERDEETLEARTYYKKLVPDVQNRLAMIIYPMLETGSSLVAAIDVFESKWL